MDRDLERAFLLADVADAITLRFWTPEGVSSRSKSDGSPVTDADIAAEEAILHAIRQTASGDAFLGEEVGDVPTSSDRRWIVDGVDGTRFFAAGEKEWGTLIALQRGDELVVGVISSPAQDRRWWAVRGQGAFTGRATTRAGAAPIHVSDSTDVRWDRIGTLPRFSVLAPQHQDVIQSMAGGRPAYARWSQQASVAEGDLDACVWFCGDTWDHAAPSIIVEEAGGRFSDHQGGRRLDTRTAVYSNGRVHDDVLASLADERAPLDG